ncbi:MAG: chemotaxis protein CheA [Opitutaceae bacterium]|nr:chemotaxis protein CheA [Opitutaceae bacterium]
MTIDMSQFHGAFFEESFEGLQIMETELLALDVGEVDSEIINTIFRAAHSIKGGAGTFGFMNVSEYTHVMETLLDEMRDGSRPVTQEAVNALLSSTDVLKGMLEAARDEVDFDEEGAVKQRAILETILLGENAVSEQQTAESKEQTTDEVGAGWLIQFTPFTDMMLTGNDPVRLLRALDELGEMDVKIDLSALPPFSEIIPEELYVSWGITLQGGMTKAEVLDVFDWVDDACELHVEPLPQHDKSDSVTPSEPVNVKLASPGKTKSAKAAEKSKTPVKKSASSEATSIRVGIDKVDEIINLVGELVITQSMLDQAGEDLEEQAEAQGKNKNTKILLRLRDGLAQLERNTRELQEGVMRIRMLPISFVFSRMPGLVHDLSGQLNKKITLVVTGEETELDKTVMENIGDPMVHLVRNALDHGIETPDIRTAAGKPETGTITLNAFHQGGNIIIQITDDGAGINKERVLAKAIEKGVISESDNLSDSDINNLIFAPGFSTAEVVSDVSGRGVGMDVVRTSIHKLGGRVEVSSEEGKGSVFTIRLPLTLAILDGQLVTVGKESYVIPLISIVESIQIDRANINVVAGKAEVYKLRNHYIPVIRSRQVFGLPGDKKDLHGALMVVVEVGNGHAGIIVDDLQGQQQVVIKSLETNYRKVETMSGATILGNGTVALIWDVAGMVNYHQKKLKQGTSTIKLSADDADNEVA